MAAIRVSTMIGSLALGAVFAGASAARASEVQDTTKWCERSQPQDASAVPAVGAASAEAANGEVGICDVDPNAPGCGIALINMAEEVKKPLKSLDDYAVPKPLCWGGCVDGQWGSIIGPTPARIMGGAALVTAAAGTIFGALALRDLASVHDSTSARFQEGQTYMALSGASFLASAALASFAIYLYLNRNARLDSHGYFATVRSGVAF
jgi:hypothetical protein